MCRARTLREVKHVDELAGRQTFRLVPDEDPEGREACRMRQSGQRGNAWSSIIHRHYPMGLI